MPGTSQSYIGVAERLRVQTEQWRAAIWQAVCAMRVAIPCVVVEFDAVTQRAKCQPVMLENVTENFASVQEEPKPLLDVPVMPVRAGGFAVTLPIKAGDECLVVFADMCINAWWQNGGTKNVQEFRGRHDLSDGFAIFAPASQPKKLANYSTANLQIRSEDGQTLIELTPSGEVHITAQKVTVTGANEVDVTSNTLVKLDGNGHTTIEGKDFLLHTHSGVTTGGGHTGGVL